MKSGRAWVVAVLGVLGVLGVLALGACAKGGAALDDGGAIDAASQVRHDAHPQTVMPDASMSMADAAVAIDASVMVDAASLGPDASTDGNLCTDNSMCTDSGECCLSIGGIGFCSPGILIGSTCLPN